MNFEDFLKQFDKQSKGEAIERRETSFELKPNIYDKNNLFKTRRSIEIGPEHETIISEKTTLHFVSCGHVIGNASDLAGFCDACGRDICSQCTSRCLRCSALLGPCCTRKIDDDPVCSFCQKILLVKKGFTGLHKLLSEDFDE